MTDATLQVAAFTHQNQTNTWLSNRGFFSPMAKVYLGDVIDHLDIVVGNIDQYVATCDHLTDSVFVSILSFYPTLPSRASRPRVRVRARVLPELALDRLRRLDRPASTFKPEIPTLLYSS